MNIRDALAPLLPTLGMSLTLAFLIPGMTIPEEDAEVGQGSKYCLVAIGRLQVRARARFSAGPERGLRFQGAGACGSAHSDPRVPSVLWLLVPVCTGVRLDLGEHRETGGEPWSPCYRGPHSVQPQQSQPLLPGQWADHLERFPKVLKMKH